MKILLTGFCPFGKHDINSSWEVAKTISHEEFNGIEVHVVQLPVSFIRVQSRIDELIETYKPDVLIMLGQSSLSNEIRLERVAINFMDSSISDNDGMIPDEQPIIADGEPAYFSNCPIKDLHTSLKQDGFSVRISNSAGTYVCNALYYYVMYRNNILGNNIKTLFVHLPLIKDMNSQDVTVGMPLDLMSKSIKSIIEYIKGHKK